MDGPNTSEQGQPATVPAHDLEHESSRVRGCCRVDIVDRLTYSMQSCGSADGQIGHAHVVVDRTDEPDDAEVTMFGELLWGNLALGMEGLEEGGPLGAEDIGSGEGTVTATDDECIDAFFDEVVCG